MTKIIKQVVLPTGTIIEAGTELQFSNEGFAHFKKEAVSIYSIPTSAIAMEMYDITTTNMRVIKGFSVGNTIVPAGTQLSFSTEGFAKFGNITLERKKIPAVALESDDSDGESVEVEPKEVASDNGSVLAEGIIAILTSDFPEGFTKGELTDAYGDKINGADYSIHEIDENTIMIVKGENDEAAEIYLTNEEDTYKLTGEFHAISDIEMVATEAFFGRIRNTKAARQNARRR
jgi:hypothetical protein